MKVYFFWSLMKYKSYWRWFVVGLRGYLTTWVRERRWGTFFLFWWDLWGGDEGLRYLYWWRERWYYFFPYNWRWNRIYHRVLVVFWRPTVFLRWLNRCISGWGVKLFWRGLWLMIHLIIDLTTLGCWFVGGYCFYFSVGLFGPGHFSWPIAKTWAEEIWIYQFLTGGLHIELGIDDNLIVNWREIINDVWRWAGGWPAYFLVEAYNLFFWVGDVISPYVEEALFVDEATLWGSFGLDEVYLKVEHWAEQFIEVEEEEEEIGRENIEDIIYGSLWSYGEAVFELGGWGYWFIKGCYGFLMHTDSQLGYLCLWRPVFREDTRGEFLRMTWGVLEYSAGPYFIVGACSCHVITYIAYRQRFLWWSFARNFIYTWLLNFLGGGSNTFRLGSRRRGRIFWGGGRRDRQRRRRWRKN